MIDSDANIKRDIKNKLIHLNMWHHFKVIKFNNVGTQLLKGPRHLFEPLHVFELAFNMDKYSTVYSSYNCVITSYLPV